jgi:ferredoxin
MAKVCVDRNRCQGIGVCESLVPHTFQITDDGVLSLNDDGEFAVEDRQQIVAAVQGCPNEALSIFED